MSRTKALPLYYSFYGKSYSEKHILAFPCLAYKSSSPWLPRLAVMWLHPGLDA